MINNEEEKLKGRSVTESEVSNFNYCINICNLDDRGFKGSKYTWWNGKTEEEHIFKRLDIILENNRLHGLFSVLEVEHLVRSGSDHTSLLITVKTNEEGGVMPFKFLNFWVKKDSFIEVVKQNSKADFEWDPFYVFHHKSKKLKKALALWIKSTFGNIFHEIITFEEVIKV